MLVSAAWLGVEQRTRVQVQSEWDIDVVVRTLATKGLNVSCVCVCSEVQMFPKAGGSVVPSAMQDEGVVRTTS